MTTYSSVRDRLERCSVECDSGCIEWVRSRTAQGYGRFAVKDGDDIHYTFAHRASYAEHKGEIPDGMCVCHTCDNRLCINPDHLWLGTTTDNNKDRSLKGRTKRTDKAFGERHGQAKLGDDDVIEIRQVARVYKKGLYKQLSQRFGVSIQAICNIVNGITWRHLV